MVLIAIAMVLGPLALWTRQHALASIALWALLLAAVFFDLRLVHRRNGSELAYSRFFGSFLTLWLLGTVAFGLGHLTPEAELTAVHSAIALVAVVLFGLFNLALLRYILAIPRSELAERNRLATWLRFSGWMIIAALVAILCTHAGLVTSQTPLVRTMILFSIIPVFEWLIRTLIQDTGYASLLTDVRVVNLFFSTRNPLNSVLFHADRGFGVDIRSTWALAVARRTVVPCVGILVVGTWLATALVAVQSSEVGIHERFGRPVKNAILQPGLHIKAPWPIDRVHRIDSSRIRSINLGFSGPKPGASLLWTKEHAAEEYDFLLGNGRDLVTLNAILRYRIGDPWAWHFTSQNPEATLQSLAEQSVFKHTSTRSLHEVLSENIETLTTSIEDEIEARLRSHALGVEIVELSLHGLHPPVRVAADYQSVVSAEIEKSQTILEGQTYRVDAIADARQAALEMATAARSAAAQKVHTARGEARSFRLLQRAHATGTKAFEHQRRLEALENSLAGRRLVVVDDRIERDGGVLWFE